ncbi:uncharacterized protein J3R85_008203 [Psidium guajava]|nr:uncharacterized protein J3R85_008203 [Psidium guajava]
MLYHVDVQYKEEEDPCQANIGVHEKRSFHSGLFHQSADLNLCSPLD